MFKMKLSNQSCLLLTRLCVLCYRPVLIEKLKCSRLHLHFQIHLDRWRGWWWRGGGRQEEMMKGKLQWPPPPLPNTPGQVERLMMERWRKTRRDDEGKTTMATTSTSKYTWTGGEAGDGEVDEEGGEYFWSIISDRWKGWRLRRWRRRRRKERDDVEDV